MKPLSRSQVMSVATAHGRRPKQNRPSPIRGRPV